MAMMVVKLTREEANERKKERLVSHLFTCCYYDFTWLTPWTILNDSLSTSSVTHINFYSSTVTMDF